MTKSLKQIQQENKKFILEAIHDCIYYESARDGIIEIIGKPLTLSRVLLAIWKSDKYYYKSSFDKAQKEMWFGEKFHTLKFGSKGVSFDLTKETLEEQSEETQRAINKLFNN